MNQIESSAFDDAGSRRVLITGAAGFLGLRLSAAFARCGWHVLGLGRSERPPKLNVEWVRADIANPELDWDGLLKDVRLVVHGAWSTVPFTADLSPANDVRDNVVSAVKLAAAAVRSRTKLIFLSSGGTVYGPSLTIPIAETHPAGPTSFYGAGKLAAEGHIRLFQGRSGLDAVILRLANPFGQGQGVGRNFGAVATFIRHALTDREIVIWGDGNVVRDYIYIDDVISAVLAAADRAVPLGPVNIGTSVGHSLNDILAQLTSVLGRSLNVRYEPPRSYDVPVNILDVSRAAAVLGWRPMISFEEGLRRTVSALRVDT